MQVKSSHLVIVLEHSIRVVTHLNLEIDALTTPDGLKLGHARLDNVKKYVDGLNGLLCDFFRRFAFGEECMVA